MAKFKITPTTTVAELKEQFSNEVGGVLRIYEGRSEAADGATLVSLGAKEGELECRTSRTVGKFEEAFQNDLNLKVKVYTKDNWVKVLDGITLATAAELPNGMTKSKMEEYLSYQRDEKEETEEAVNEATDNMDGLKELLGLPIVDVIFEQIGWPITENDKEKYKNLLERPGIAAFYEYEKLGDFEAHVTGWEDDSLSETLVWAEKYQTDDKKKNTKAFIVTNLRYVGNLIEEEYRDRTNDTNNMEVITYGLNRYVGDNDCGNTWWRNEPILFRVKLDDHTDYFTISGSGNFDTTWNLTNAEFEKLFEYSKDTQKRKCQSSDDAIEDGDME